MKKSAMLFCIETTLLFLQASYRSFAVSPTLSGVDYTNNYFCDLTGGTACLYSFQIHICKSIGTSSVQHFKQSVQSAASQISCVQSHTKCGAMQPGAPKGQEIEGAWCLKGNTIILEYFRNLRSLSQEKSA